METPYMGERVETRDLVQRAKAGDRTAFDALVERYRGVTFGVAYGLLGDAHDAEDATQESLTRAWCRLTDLREPDKFAGWLYRITQNHCRNFLARSRRATIPIEEVEGSLASAQGKTNNDAADAVQEALLSLSEIHRVVTTLYYVEGYAVADVARLLDIPVGTVKRRLHDSRHHLRQASLTLGATHANHQKGLTMQLFTGKGDQGDTDLLSGGRVGKDDPRIAVLGALDEATSAIGFGRALSTSSRTKDLLIEIQHDLYRLMAGLAFTSGNRPSGYGVEFDRVVRLETLVNELSSEVDIPPRFVLPGDSAAGAALDVARTVIRRAEREAVALAHGSEPEDPSALSYLNRLSSFLFVIARLEDHIAGVVPLQATEMSS